MGMYTELNIGVSLRADTPDKIVDILKYMLGDIDEKVETTDHALFSTRRWHYMLVSDSYYFDSYTDSSMRRDDLDHQYKLNVRCNLKNYNNEIDLFLDFIRPYLQTNGFLGYKRYEECDDPTLIYHDIYKNIIEFKRVQDYTYEY